MNITSSSCIFCGFRVLAKVSLDRISKFLLETELLDRFSQTASLPSWDALGTDAYGTIGFKNAGFIWSKVAEDAVADSQSSQNFILRVPGELRFKHGGINLIVGPTYDSWYYHLSYANISFQWFWEDVNSHGFARWVFTVATPSGDEAIEFS